MFESKEPIYTQARIFLERINDQCIQNYLIAKIAEIKAEAKPASKTGIALHPKIPEYTRIELFLNFIFQVLS